MDLHLLQQFLNVLDGPALESLLESILSDPNVWRSLMNNPKVKEFLVSLNNDTIIDCLLHMLGKWVKNLGNRDEDIALEEKDRILMMVNGISNFVNSIFGNSSSDKSSDDDEYTSFMGKSETTQNGSCLVWLGNLLVKIGDWVKKSFDRVRVMAKNVMVRVVEMVTDFSKYVFNIFSFGSSNAAEYGSHKCCYVVYSLSLCNVSCSF